MARIPFTAAEKTIICQTARVLWNQIAYDIFAAMAASNPTGDHSMSRSHVIEVIMDADRLYLALKVYDKSLAERYQRADTHHIERILADAFPAKEYA